MKLSKSIFNLIFLVSILSTLLISIMFILFQFNNFNKEKDYIKKEYLQTKKDLIKKEVLSVYNYVEYKEKNQKLLLRKRLEQRVTQAHKIAKQIYDNNINKLTKEQIKYLIVAALKDISYENSRQYFFINTNDGRAILFNKKSYLHENKNVWNLKDIKGQYLVRNQSKIALSKDSGFVRNYFVKPDLNDNKQYPKLTFVKNFKEFNWHIGTGEYLDDFLYAMKQDILNYISTIRFDKDGYIFVNRTDKKALVFDGTKLDKPKTYPNDKLFEKELKAIKNKDGGYFFYRFKKLNNEKSFPKMGYVKEYQNWNWIIGSGVYIDEVQAQIEKKSDELKTIIKSEIFIILIFLIFCLILIYFISRNLTRKITQNLTQLTNSFEIASKNLSLIDSKKFSFEEFKLLSNNLNEVLIARNNSNEKLQNYLNIVDSHVIISTTDINGKILQVSDAFCEISGYSKEELIGGNHNILKHEDIPIDTFTQLWSTIKNKQIWKGELKNKRKDGNFYWVELVIEPNLKDNEIIGFTAIMNDISDKKIVEYLSITDELTGLYNRRYFNQKIEEEINRTKRDNQFFSFIVLDIDYFKKYNDTYGHLLGDEALKKISLVLSSMSNRSSDFVFRLGGEEFGIIISNQNKEKVFTYTENIRQAIEQLHIEHTKSQVSKHITVSIGIATRNAIEIKDSNEIYRLADEALYISKRNGRNQVNES